MLNVRFESNTCWKGGVKSKKICSKLPKSDVIENNIICLNTFEPLNEDSYVTVVEFITHKNTKTLDYQLRNLKQNPSLKLRPPPKKNNSQVVKECFVDSNNLPLALSLIPSLSVK